jgi:ferredoxin
MPSITVQGKIINCESGANLRQVLLKNQIPVHNGNAKVINCRGIGTCGTCAVAIAGKVSTLGWKEQARLSLPPHGTGTTRRLACQVEVLGNLTVTKFDGFWGQGDRLNY